MSDVSVPAVDDGEEQPDEKEASRKEIKNLREAAAEGRLLKKENVFLRAGIDLSNKPAQGLFKSYDGELTVEAVQAEAKEWGLLDKPAPAADGPSADDLEQQRFRDGAAQGTAAGSEPAPKGMRRADVLPDFWKDQGEGVPLEQAQLAAIDKFVSGAAEGNTEFLFDEGAWIAERAQMGHDFRSRRG